MDSKQNTYFLELRTGLQQEGYTVLPEQDGCLPVEWNDRPLCQITSGGSIRFRPDDIQDPDTDVALTRVTNIAAVVKEYMTLLEDAPDLKADGLHDPYKLLAEYNDTVLAARSSEQCGVQFVTWRWGHEKASLYYGHYFDQAIWEYLCSARFDTTKHLADRFDVCERTIRSDLVTLACTYPIETSFGPYGGIRVSNWYHPEQKRLSPKQTSLLVRVRMTLEGEDLKVMNSILIQFALPGSY